jgi:hypothetical protein
MLGRLAYAALLALALLLRHGAAQADLFPDKPFKGMQIDFQLDGMAITDAEDEETARQTTRKFRGVVTGNKVRVSGQAFSVEEKAEVTVKLSAGHKTKDAAFDLKPNPGRREFMLELDVPKGARGAHFLISVMLEKPAGPGPSAIRTDGRFAAKEP